MTATSTPPMMTKGRTLFFPSGVGLGDFVDFGLGDLRLIRLNTVSEDF